MNFSYGVIAAMGILVAVSIGFISSAPGEIIKDRVADYTITLGMPVTEGDAGMGTVDAASTQEELRPVVVVPVGTSVVGCEVDDTCYLPGSLVVPVGTTVTWSNEDTAAHTVTSGTLTDGSSGLFDTGLFAPGATFEHTFDAAGTYDYYCIVHPWMTGVVTVGNN